MKYFLAVDIGATSGRHIVGYEENGEIKLDEVFRFETGFYRDGGRILNDIEKLVSNVIEGIRIAFGKYKEIESLAIDTWGVDYVLMKGDEEVLPVYSYRDERTLKVTDEVHSIVPFEKLYEKTGIQFQPFNTIYQLYSDKVEGRLDGVTDFLMLPEYISYRLTGIKKKEYTNASTTGLVNAESCEYDGEIIKKLGLPENLFSEINQPPAFVGELKPCIKEKVGGNTKVVLCASHDTASAVEGIPMEDNALFLSSGTWSLLGVKSKVAHTDEKSRKANCSNEGGVGYIRLLKNIMGMWLVNSLKKELCDDASFPEIVKLAKESDYRKTVDVFDGRFFSPASMKQAVDESLCEKDLSVGDYFRCAYESLADGYRRAIGELEIITGEKYEKLYIVGGGAKNELLNSLTEEKCKIKVIALPIEATTLGNIKIQMSMNYGGTK